MERAHPAVSGPGCVGRVLRLPDGRRPHPGRRRLPIDPLAPACSACPLLCCDHLHVPLTGCDLHALVEQLRVPAATLAEAQVVDGPGPGHFRLGPAAPWQRLYLLRPGEPPSPCILLLPFHGSYRRCAAWDSIPSYCAAYPIVREAERPRVRTERHCPAGSFRPAEEPSPEWQARLERWERRLATDQLVLDHVTRIAEALPEGEELPLAMLLAFQLRVRDALGRVGVVDGVRGWLLDLEEALR